MYKSGDLRITKVENQDVFDARGDYETLPSGIAYLPHSCDYWVIGGPTEISMLIDDLTKLLEETK